MPRGGTGCESVCGPEGVWKRRAMEIGCGGPGVEDPLVEENQQWDNQMKGAVTRLWGMILISKSFMG